MFSLPWRRADPALRWCPAPPSQWLLRQCQTKRLERVVSSAKNPTASAKTARPKARRTLTHPVLVGAWSGLRAVGLQPHPSVALGAATGCGRSPPCGSPQGQGQSFSRKRCCCQTVRAPSWKPAVHWWSEHRLCAPDLLTLGRTIRMVAMRRASQPVAAGLEAERSQPTLTCRAKHSLEGFAWRNSGRDHQGAAVLGGSWRCRVCYSKTLSSRL